MVSIIILLLVIGFVMHGGIPKILNWIEEANTYWNSFPESIKGTGEIFVFFNLLLWHGRLYNHRIVHIGSSTIFIWMAGIIGFLSVFFQDIPLERITIFPKLKSRIIRIHPFIYRKILKIIYGAFKFISRICRLISFILIAFMLVTIVFLIVSRIKGTNIPEIEVIADFLIYEALFGILITLIMVFSWFYRRIILLSLSLKRVFFIFIFSFFMMPITFNLIQNFFPIPINILMILYNPFTFLLIFFNINVGVSFIFRSSKFAGDVLQRTSAILTIIAFCLLIWSSV